MARLKASPHLRQLIASMLRPDPSARPSAQVLLRLQSAVVALLKEHLWQLITTMSQLKILAAWLTLLVRNPT